MTPAVTRWARSSPRTSSQGRRSSLTAGPLTGPSAARDISTGPSTRKRPAPLGMTRHSLLPGVHRVASRCASGGCWTPTRARLTPRTCPPISTSCGLPVQPPPIGQPGHGVLPGPAASRRPRASPVRGSARQQKAAPCEASRGRHGTARRARAPSGGPPVADRRNPAAVSSPVKWIPQTPLIAGSHTRPAGHPARQPDSAEDSLPLTAEGHIVSCGNAAPDEGDSHTFSLITD